MFSPLAIMPSLTGLFSATATCGMTLLSSLTTEAKFFSEMARGQWQRLHELTAPNTSVRLPTFDTLENTARLATTPLLQSGLGLWVGLGAIAVVLVGGAILRGRKPSIPQTHPGLEILMGSPVPEADQEVPPPVGGQALPPQSLTPLAERRQTLSERTWNYAKIIDRLEDWDFIKQATSQWKYILVQLSDGNYELRVSPPYTEHRDRDINHHQLLFLSDDERMVGAGYIVHTSEMETFFVDGMSAMFPTDNNGPRGGPWILARPAEQVGLKAVQEILKEKFDINVRHVWSVNHIHDADEEAT